MKLSGKYRIEISGDIEQLGLGYDHGAIGYLFQRLLSGEEAAMENLANLGITVRDVTGEDEFVAIPRMS